MLLNNNALNLSHSIEN